MNVQELIQALQALENKELPVCVFDGMDLTTVHHLVIADTRYWSSTGFQQGEIVNIIGK